jgi:hypothetical protein
MKIMETFSFPYLGRQFFAYLPLLFLSCSSNFETEKISYTVSSIDNDFICEYLTLTKKNSRFTLQQQKVVWEGKFTFEDGSSIEAESTTGLLNTNERFWLHPPRIGPLEILEAFPFPDVRFPIYTGKQWSATINVVSGFDELNGKSIKSNYIVREFIVIEQDTTWIIDSFSKVPGKDEEYQLNFHYNNKQEITLFDYKIDNNPFITISR